MKLKGYVDLGRDWRFFWHLNPFRFSFGYVTLVHKRLTLRALCAGPVELQHWKVT